MVPKSGASGNNTYDEYFLVVTGQSGSQTKKFEKIGDSAVDLTNYATKSYVDTAKSSAISTGLLVMHHKGKQGSWLMPRHMLMD